jgi:hypothetical protein
MVEMFGLNRPLPTMIQADFEDGLVGKAMANRPAP